MSLGLVSYAVLIATFAKVLARGGEGDPNGVGMVLGDLHGVSVWIGVRCGQRSWNLRGPDQSFAMFCAGVVHGLRGVGVGEVVHDILSVSLSVVLEVHASLAVFTERLSLSLYCRWFSITLVPGVRHFWIGACCGGLANGRLS